MRAARLSFSGVVVLKPVDVVIPVADRNDEITKKCLAHLERTQKYPYNIILVEEKGPSFSYGKSMNKGIRQAESEIVIGMDSDSFPEPGAIDTLIKFAQKYPQVGYFGAKIRNFGFVESIGWIYSNNPIDLLRTVFWTKAPLFYLKIVKERGLFYWDIRFTKRFVDGMIGQATSLFALRKECWEDVGGFDERFKIAYSDVDFCFRILLSENWYITCCPNAIVSHLGHVTTFKENKTWSNKESEELFKRKWPHDRILQVVEASKRGKFIIPTDNKRQ
jgi:GT2 family glycosyltransferase